METTPRGAKKVVVGDPATAYREAIDANADLLSNSIAYGDCLQAGAVAAADWSFTANVVAGTGDLGSVANTGGTAWLPDPVVAGALMRTVTPAAKLAGFKPGLPAVGKYVNVAFELTPASWGAPATVSVRTGVEQATQVSAEASPPATTAGKMQVLQIVLLNNAGVYEIKAQIDVRLWAGTGPWLPVTLATKIEASGGATLGVRTESAGQVGRFSGRVKVKVGQTLASGDAIMSSIAWACRPKQGTFLQLAILTEGVVLGKCQVEPSLTGPGVCTYEGPSLVAGKVLFLESMPTYPLF